jgi:hypothetical protein
VGPGTATSTAPAIYAGGDPGATYSPANFWAVNVQMDSVKASGFASGFQHGSNFWAGQIARLWFIGNVCGVKSQTQNSTNSGEKTVIAFSNFSNNSQGGFCLSDPGDTYNFDNGNCDYNAACISGNGAYITIQDTWLEQNNAPFINITNVPSANSNVVVVKGGGAQLAQPSANVTHISVSGSGTTLTTGSTLNLLSGQSIYLYGFAGYPPLNGQYFTSSQYQISGTTVLIPSLTGSYSGAESSAIVSPVDSELFHVEGNNPNGSIVTIQDVYVTGHNHAVRYIEGNGVEIGNTVCLSNNIVGWYGFPPNELTGISPAAGYLAGCTDQSGRSVTHLYVPTGANAYAGTATLDSGTAIINTTGVASNSNVILTLQSCSSCGTLYVGTVAAGSSFVIKSTNASDASTVYWEIR